MEKTTQSVNEILALAYEAAFDATLGEDYGNFMERRMLVEEMSFDIPAYADKLVEMNARLVAAKNAGNAARLKVNY